MYRIVLIACLLFSQVAVAQSPDLPGFPPGVFQDTNALTGGGSAPAFQGLGDLSLGTVAYYHSVAHCYSNAYTGKTADLVDTATGLTQTTGTCLNGVVSWTGATGCTQGSSCAAKATVCAVSCSPQKQYDQSGQSNCSGPCDIVNFGAGVSNLPTLAIAQFNGHDCPLYTVANSQSMTNATGFTLAVPYTYVAWAERTTFAGAATDIINTASGYTFQLTSSANTVGMYDGNNFNTATANDGTAHSLMSVYAGSGSEYLVVDGSATPFAATGVNATGAIFIGQRPNSTEYMNGYICEDSAWASSEYANRAAINTNLATFW